MKVPKSSGEVLGTLCESRVSVAMVGEQSLAIGDLLITSESSTNYISFPYTSQKPPVCIYTFISLNGWAISLHTTQKFDLWA